MKNRPESNARPDVPTRPKDSGLVRLVAGIDLGAAVSTLDLRQVVRDPLDLSLSDRVALCRHCRSPFPTYTQLYKGRDDLSRGAPRDDPSVVGAISTGRFIPWRGGDSSRGKWFCSTSAARVCLLPGRPILLPLPRCLSTLSTGAIVASASASLRKGGLPFDGACGRMGDAFGPRQRCRPCLAVRAYGCVVSLPFVSRPAALVIGKEGQAIEVRPRLGSPFGRDRAG